MTSDMLASPARTAIRRKNVSAPVKYLLDNDLLTKPVINYGGGYDSESSRALEADHYDPYIYDYNNVQSFSNTWETGYCGYVLNVIAEPTVRKNTVGILETITRTAFIAVRSDKIDGNDYGDGVVTQRNTFQKSYTADEFMHEFAEFGPVLVHKTGFYLLFKIGQ